MMRRDLESPPEPLCEGWWKEGETGACEGAWGEAVTPEEQQGT